MRSDARQNYDRLLTVAADAFARYGAQATLRAIAEEAGVGIGTLYRHFPSRESLVDAVYRAETQRLCASAPELLDRLPPVDALRAWALRFIDFMATKSGMTDVLHTILNTDETLRQDTRTRIDGALRLLIQACQRAGRLRDDLDLDDVALALGGFALIVDSRANAREAGARLFDLLLIGLEEH
jgi:AcrR family transcriptional regulator